MAITHRDKQTTGTPFSVCVLLRLSTTFPSETLVASPLVFLPKTFKIDVVFWFLLRLEFRNLGLKPQDLIIIQVDTPNRMFLTHESGKESIESVWKGEAKRGR